MELFTKVRELLLVREEVVVEQVETQVEAMVLVGLEAGAAVAAAADLFPVPVARVDLAAAAAVAALALGGAMPVLAGQPDNTAAQVDKVAAVQGQAEAAVLALAGDCSIVEGQ